MKTETNTDDASKSIGVGIITAKTNYIIMSGHQTAGQNLNTEIANKLFENVARVHLVVERVRNQTGLKKWFIM
jgi:hypothetical protein